MRVAMIKIKFKNQKITIFGEDVEKVDTCALLVRI